MLHSRPILDSQVVYCTVPGQISGCFLLVPFLQFVFDARARPLDTKYFMQETASRVGKITA
jgi:hypothetical protein